MSSNSTAVAVRDESTAVAAPRAMRLLRPIAEPAAVIEAQNAAREMVHKALVQGRDYGVIPGAGDKPAMLKPGAERVALAFGCYYGTPEIIEQEADHDREVRWIKRKKKWRNGHPGDREFTWEEEAGVSLGLYRYVVRVPVVERASGEVVGSGVGMCSSMESKYIDRPRDTENTVLKMAHKRAMVAACLITFGLSDEFTQDVEDMAQFSGDEADSRGGRAASTDAPAGEPEAKCPTCSGRMWDNRTNKTNPKSPDFKCRNRSCDGAYWPGQWPPAPAATEEQKAKILALLATADLNDDAKAKTLARVNDATKPLTAKTACTIIDKLEKLAEPDDPTQTDLLAGSGEQPENPTKLAPGKVEDALDTRTTARPATPAPAAPADAPSIAALTKRMNKLLQHEKLTKAEREDFLTRAADAKSIDDLQRLVIELEEVVASPI